MSSNETNKFDDPSVLYFLLQRYSDNGDSTLGLLFERRITGPGQVLKFLNYTIEDEHREVKVKSETRIPEGFYELKIARFVDARGKEIVSPLTKRYRDKYPWFKNHIEITNIPNFTAVYCHIGNTDNHSAGCVLFGDTANNNMKAEGFIGESTEAFKRWYERVFAHLESGKRAFFEIRDEYFLTKVA